MTTKNGLDFEAIAWKVVDSLTLDCSDDKAVIASVFAQALKEMFERGAKVVLPEEKDMKFGHSYEFTCGWNGCYDEIIRLNPHLFLVGKNNEREQAKIDVGCSWLKDE